MKAILSLMGVLLSVSCLAEAQYKILPPISQGNLTVFPVVSTGGTFDTNAFITLDEGIRSGEVIVTETGAVTGLVRPRVHVDGGVWRERPMPVQRQSAQVNELSLVNNSARPLLLLAGEIVTGGKQDRVVGKDRIIPAHSQPVGLGVFCVEPHRWTETSAHFGSLGTAMAQPSVRAKALFQQDQQGVWDAVAKSREALASRLAAPAAAPVRQSSSYAMAMKSSAVAAQVDQVAKPFEQSYGQLIQKLREEKAVGAVVAVNGEIIWADAFASSDLLNRFWEKLIRSYATESLGTFVPAKGQRVPSEKEAQNFLDRLGATHENIETEPGVYRQTEIQGDNYTAFVLTSLLNGKEFTVHLAKMRR